MPATLPRTVIAMTESERRRITNVMERIESLDNAVRRIVKMRTLPAALRQQADDVVHLARRLSMALEQIDFEIHSGM